MPTLPPPEAHLARLVSTRAQLTLHLLDGLRAMILDLGRSDILPVIDLVSRNAAETLHASDTLLAARHTEKRARILDRLGRLSKLGGPRAAREAHRLAEDLASNSGSYPAILSPKNGPVKIP